MKLNNFNDDFDMLNSQQWYRVMHGERTVEDLAAKIKSKQFPEWCDPLLQNTSIGDSMLELGSSTGELSAILGLYGRIPHLLDFSAESIAFTKSLFKLLGIKGHFYYENILEGLSLKTSSVDWVWSSGLLEHFPDEKIEYILNASIRVCKKGVMSLVPNASSIFYRIGKFKMEQEGTWVYGNEMPKFTMKNFFKAAGLKKIKEYSLGPYHAIKFWSENDRIIKIFYDHLDPSELRKLNQGYLLFTYGEKKN
jgi:ubiquinone/menaquinone biosynthesis C-methylase UbiE